MDIKVRNVSEALVREFLSRHGMQATLKQFDIEHPPKPGEQRISSRKELCEILSFGKEMHKNKLKEIPLLSIMEVLVEKQLLPPGQVPQRANSLMNQRREIQPQKPIDDKNDEDNADGLMKEHILRSKFRTAPLLQQSSMPNKSSSQAFSISPSQRREQTANERERNSGWTQDQTTQEDNNNNEDDDRKRLRRIDRTPSAMGQHPPQNGERRKNGKDEDDDDEDEEDNKLLSKKKYLDNKDDVDDSNERKRNVGKDTNKERQLFQSSNDKLDDEDSGDQEMRNYYEKGNRKQQERNKEINNESVQLNRDEQTAPPVLKGQSKQLQLNQMSPNKQGQRPQFKKNGQERGFSNSASQIVRRTSEDSIVSKSENLKDSQRSDPKQSKLIHEWNMDDVEDDLEANKQPHGQMGSLGQQRGSGNLSNSQNTGLLNFGQPGQGARSPSISALSFSSSLDSTSLTSAVTLSAASLQKMQKMIFGPRVRPQFPQAWMQGFIFRDVSEVNPFGLIQEQGGPCGIIAAVQAHILFFAFHDKEESERIQRNFKGRPGTSGGINTGNKRRPPQPPGIGTSHRTSQLASFFTSLHLTEDQQTRLLVLSIASILWRAGQGQSAVVVSLSTPCELSSGFPRASALKTLRVESADMLRRVVSASLSSFRGPWGVCLLLLSLMQSRGCDEMEGDADFPQPYIDSHSYCSQEMVNCMLTGKARGNCFDGDHIIHSDQDDQQKEKIKDDEEEDANKDENDQNKQNNLKNQDDLLLHGVAERNEIGFLSIHDVYGQLPVGHNLKHPIKPIWVLNFESHYSVVFSPQSLSILDDFYQGMSSRIWGQRNQQQSPSLSPAAIQTSSITAINIFAQENIPGSTASSAFMAEVKNKRLEVFDLYYYDQLWKEPEEIKITVGAPSPSSSSLDFSSSNFIGSKIGQQLGSRFNSKYSQNTGSNIPQSINKMTPPLELLLTSCFCGATYDWNGTQPFL